MPQVEHIVFDLGKVLVDFSYRQLFPLLRRQGALIRDAEDFAAQVGLIDYEQGQITTAEFLQRIDTLLSAPLGETTLRKVWCDIFTPIPQMISLVRRLRSQARTYIISNTGEIHWQYLTDRFALPELYDDAFASCEVGVMKPAADIYATAEKRFGFTPAQVVFIDDRHENIAGASSCGWHTIHHRSYGQTREALIELGFRIPN